MFELSQFYTWCRETGVDVIPFAHAPSPGATFRDGCFYAIFLDFTQIPSTRLLKGICAHEMGHAATGALHRVNSPFETVARSEARAKAWTAQNCLTEGDFREAFAAGCRELWQVAEYLDLPERDVLEAYRYWTERRGVDFHTISR